MDLRRFRQMQKRVIAAQVSPLAPNAASQPMLAAYGIRRINPSYTGPLLALDISGTPTLCYADADGWADVSIIGGGTDRDLMRLYDQSANGAGTGRYIAWAEYFGPKLWKNGGPTVNGASKCWLDLSVTGTRSFALPGVTIDVGGTNNVSVFAVFDTLGFPGSARPGTDEDGVWASSILSYGDTSSDSNDNQLLTTIYNDGSTFATAEAVPYKLVGRAMELHKPLTPPLTGGPINVWFNQAGAVMAGGGDTRIHWAGAPHGIAAAADQGLLLGRAGSRGANFSHNGKFYEFIVYNPATPLSDTECQRIALHQRLGYGTPQQLVNTRLPEVNYINPTGQSNAANHIDAGTSWSGSYTVEDYENAMQRIGTPLLATLTGKAQDEFAQPARLLNTAYSQSALMKTAVVDAVANPTAQGSGNPAVYNAPRDGVGQDLFWWDTTLDIPGPCLEGWKAKISAETRLHRATRSIQFWVQGEQEAAAITYDATAQTLYRTTWYKAVRAMRAHLLAVWGITNAPFIVSQIAHRSNTGGDYGENHWAHYLNLERMVDEAAAQTPAVLDVHWSASVGYLDLHTDQIHWARGPANAFGYDASSKQFAYAMAAQVFDVAGTKWQGPYIASATKASTTIDLACAWDSDGGGTALAGRDGSTTGLFGFQVRDGSGNRTVTGAAFQSATVVRVTVSGAAFSGTTQARYNPHQYTDSVETRPKTVVDNNAAMPLPLQTSPWITAP